MEFRFFNRAETLARDRRRTPGYLIFLKCAATDDAFSVGKPLRFSFSLSGKSGGGNSTPEDTVEKDKGCLRPSILKGENPNETEMKVAKGSGRAGNFTK